MTAMVESPTKLVNEDIAAHSRVVFTLRSVNIICDKIRITRFEGTI